MDPRFSFSKSYPVQHPDWAEAIQNSKVDYSIEPIGRALRILYSLYSKVCNFFLKLESRIEKVFANNKNDEN